MSGVFGLICFVLQTRSDKLERIDTGAYTPEEYERFLREIRLVNRFAGDNRALRKSLLHQIEKADLQNFSVLDVGAGSGELLRAIAKFTGKQNRTARLCGLELNARSARAITEESKSCQVKIEAVRGDAFRLPFADDTFDYAICSLFTHHFSDENVTKILREMSRVSRRRIYAIDLHRHAGASFFYKIFCAAFRISPLVREDGSLSILRSFTPDELETLGRAANFERFSVQRYFPFRLVFEGEKTVAESCR